MTGIIIERLWIDREDKPDTHVEKREGGYRFINPLLECGNTQASATYWEYRTVRREIEVYINEAVNKKRLYQASVYFRDLTNGPFFGINMEERFSPASLLKVPLMIAYLKKAESQPTLLKKRLVYDGKQDFNKLKNFKGSLAIEPGKGYAVDELIRMMIVFSDNNAMRLLFDDMERGFREKVYHDLGIIDLTETGEYIMSVETYAFCFRVLFNASYLNRELSEQALRYLAQPDFQQGIVRGVPPDITVAQKYGERLYEKNNIRELHDCGIVYYPNRPYLLCVMTRGANYGVLADATKDISAILFKEVHRRQAAHNVKSN